MWWKFSTSSTKTIKYEFHIFIFQQIISHFNLVQLWENQLWRFQFLTLQYIYIYDVLKTIWFCDGYDLKYVSGQYWNRAWTARWNSNVMPSIVHFRRQFRPSNHPGISLPTLRLKSVVSFKSKARLCFILTCSTPKPLPLTHFNFCIIKIDTSLNSDPFMLFWTCSYIQRYLSL